MSHSIHHSIPNFTLLQEWLHSPNPKGMYLGYNLSWQMLLTNLPTDRGYVLSGQNRETVPVCHSPGIATFPVTPHTLRFACYSMCGTFRCLGWFGLCVHMTSNVRIRHVWELSVLPCLTGLEDCPDST